MSAAQASRHLDQFRHHQPDKQDGESGPSLASFVGGGAAAAAAAFDSLTRPA